MFPQLQNSLRENKLFDKVKESDLNFHVSLENLLDRKAGEIIYKEGDAGSCVYVIIAGSVAIDKTHLLGRSKKTIVSADDFFGEEDYLEDMPRTSTAYALEDSTIIRLEGDILSTLCTDSPQFYCNVRRIPNESQEIGSSEAGSIDDLPEIKFTADEFSSDEVLVNEVSANETFEVDMLTEEMPYDKPLADAPSHLDEISVLDMEDQDSGINSSESEETSNIELENIPAPEIANVNSEDTEEPDEKLPESERITSMDQMVNSLIQNIKKPVLVSKRYAEHLKTKDLSPDAAQIADMLLEQLNHVSDLVQTTLSFSEEKTILNSVKCKLNETLDAVFDKLNSNNFNRNWEIVKQYDKDANVKLDRGEFYKCCMHIVRNAYDAMPDGGRIFVTTKKRKNFVDISFKDSGPGIHESVKNKIFEPFMSYGKTGGTGLGLAITRKIIEGHGGTVSAQNIPGEGAIFTITIPAFKE